MNNAGEYISREGGREGGRGPPRFCILQVSDITCERGSLLERSPLASRFLRNARSDLTRVRDYSLGFYEAGMKSREDLSRRSAKKAAEAEYHE